jgi:HTH-type transcriptional regulator, glycine betaine synthesis regulator
MQRVTEQKTPAKNSRADAAPLNGVESEIIGLFVQIARVIGLPRSVGEIYGLLFITARPMAMDDLIERLGISKGSASQGLKFLRGAGAIQLVYVPNDRRMHFEAVAELRNLVVRFLRDQLVPNLDTSLSRLDRITGLVKALPSEERARVAPRVTMLQSWQKKTRRFLPLVVKLLGR